MKSNTRTTPDFASYLMQEAIAEAKLAYQANEVPIGAVLAKDTQIIARAHNLVEKDSSVTKHAELLVLEMAGRLIEDWRLNDYTLCVTVEPCSMCIGAIKLSRINTLIFGANDPSMGACGSIYDLSQDNRFGAVPRVISGVMEEECRNLMSDFFKEKRK